MYQQLSLEILLGCCLQGYWPHQFGTCWSVFLTLRFSFSFNYRRSNLWRGPVDCQAPSHNKSGGCRWWFGTLFLCVAEERGGKLGRKPSCWPSAGIARHPGCSSVPPVPAHCRCVPEPHWQIVCGRPVVWCEVWRIILVGLPGELSSTSAIPQSFLSWLTLSLRKFIFEVTFDRWLLSMAVFHLFPRLHEANFNIIANITVLYHRVARFTSIITV